MTYRHLILVVDDDADDREIMKDAFSAASEKQECLFFENGDKLLDYLEKNLSNGLPSLILLDWNMPGKDGREILKELKTNKQLSFIPVVVFTTSSAPHDRTISYELGANCFVTKPDTYSKLVELATSITRLWLS